MIPENRIYTHIDLFSGIGGFALAANWAGFETIAFCEIDPFCQKVLTRRFNGQVVTDAEHAGLDGTQDREGDIKRRNNNETGKNCPLKPSGPYLTTPIYPDIRKFDGTKYRGATLLTGGFPCQPFSVAGKRKGKDDDRFLWPQMFRIIKESRPRWIIAENVPGIVNMALGQVLSDLESEGYDFPRDLAGNIIVPVIPACSKNAPHKRDRCWIIAHSINGRPQEPGTEQQTGGDRQPNENASDSQGGESGEQTERERREDIGGGSWQENWYEVATRLCVVDDGLPGGLVRPKGWRVNALKAAGNAIVPQVAYEILKGIAEKSI